MSASHEPNVPRRRAAAAAADSKRKAMDLDTSDSDLSDVPSEPEEFKRPSLRNRRTRQSSTAKPRLEAKPASSNTRKRAASSSTPRATLSTTSSPTKRHRSISGDEKAGTSSKRRKSEVLMPTNRSKRLERTSTLTSVTTVSSDALSFMSSPQKRSEDDLSVSEFDHAFALMTDDGEVSPNGYYWWPCHVTSCLPFTISVFDFPVKSLARMSCGVNSPSPNCIRPFRNRSTNDIRFSQDTYCLRQDIGAERQAFFTEAWQFGVQDALKEDESEDEPDDRIGLFAQRFESSAEHENLPSASFVQRGFYDEELAREAHEKAQLLVGQTCVIRVRQHDDDHWPGRIQSVADFVPGRMEPYLNVQLFNGETFTKARSRVFTQSDGGPFYTGRLGQFEILEKPSQRDWDSYLTHIRPIIICVIRDDYPPAQDLIKQFLEGGLTRQRLATQGIFGTWTEEELEKLRDSLEGFVLGRTKPCRDGDSQSPAASQTQGENGSHRLIGSMAYEDLSSSEQSQFCTDVLLQEVVIQVTLWHRKLRHTPERLSDEEETQLHEQGIAALNDESRHLWKTYAEVEDLRAARMSANSKALTATPQAPLEIVGGTLSRPKFGSGATLVAKKKGKPKSSGGKGKAKVKVKTDADDEIL